MLLAEAIGPARRAGAAACPAAPGPRTLFIGLTAALALAVLGSFVVSVEAWTPGAILAVPLVALAALWIAGGAATALVGLAARLDPASVVPAGWIPQRRTAILVTLCGEDAVPLGAHLAGLHRRLEHLGLGAAVRLVVLSDTSDVQRAAAEEASLAALRRAGVVEYRRRAENTGHKPGNIAEWVERAGDEFDYMVVLDADSRVTADRVRALVWRMEQRPRLGLLQAGIALVPGRSRFGRHQRVAARLLGHNFGRGLAAWSADAGNYWGHNAIMRVDAFRAAVRLPRLSGSAPLGGAILSHDFVEAAWIRRAGWAVALDPDAAGSAEDAPQTLAAFLRRDRRWCQGNLQHLRLLTEPGLHPLSRLHLASGVVGYLVAPIWLLLVVLMASGAVPVAGVLPLALAALVLLLPKFCALGSWGLRARTRRRRWVVLKAWAAELSISSVIAPLVMVRQAQAVGAVCLGRDCGWKSPRGPGARLPRGLGEAALGAALVALALWGASPGAVWLAPVVLPLLAAPVVVPALDAGA